MATTAKPQRPTMPMEEMIRRLTPTKIRELGDEYGVRLTGTTGLTADQATFLWVAGAAVIFFSGLFAFGLIPKMIPLFRYSGLAQLLLFIAGLALPLLWTPHFLRYAPKYTLLLAENYFTGELHPFTQGANLKAPWYLIRAKDYIDVRLIIIEGTTAFVSKDGVVITYSWTVQSRIHAPLLGLNTRIGLEDVAKGVADVVENALAKEFLGKSARMLRNPQMVRRMENHMLATLNAPLPEWIGDEDEEVTFDLEKNPVWIRFGMIIEIATLGAPDFSEEYKQALTGQAIAKIINDTAQQFIADTKASPDVALNSALIINKEGVKRDIIAFEGVDKALGKALVTVMRVFRK